MAYVCHYYISDLPRAKCIIPHTKCISPSKTGLYGHTNCYIVACHIPIHYSSNLILTSRQPDPLGLVVALLDDDFSQLRLLKLQFVAAMC